MEAFDCLPLAAIVTTKQCGKFFCCHAGIGPTLKELDDINKINRFREVPDSGVFCDLLWIDPVSESESVGFSPTRLEEWHQLEFKPNPVRGISFVMYYKAALSFCQKHNFTSIIRGHEVQKYGYFEHHFRMRDRDHPLMITIFSAPNYCGTHENHGSIIKLNDDGYEFVDMGWTTVPFRLPNFQNAISFSLPFFIENVMKICRRLTAPTNEEKEEQNAALLRDLRAEEERDDSILRFDLYSQILAVQSSS